jgi:predicted extracellular nuclease
MKSEGARQERDRMRWLACGVLLLTPACEAVDEPSSGCGAPATAIHRIQGAGARSPEEGRRHVVEGIVVGDFQGTDRLSGFFLQQHDPDDDPATSEGIFVYDAGRGPDVDLGDRVRVEGEVREFEGPSGRGAPLTELVEPRQLSICARGQELASTPVALPVAEADDWERYEGMRVHLPQRLRVTDNYELRRYGVLGLAPERLFAATQRVDPGAPARERAARDALGLILVDDGSARVDPEPRRPGPPARAGDALVELGGVVDQRFGAYRVQPVGPLEIVADNPRPAVPPPVGGRLRVAAFNVHNLFHTLDRGEAVCGPARDLDCRGARTPQEREHQLAALAAALRGLDADVVGLVEVENGPADALRNLVAALDGSGEDARYAFVDTGPIGRDAIRVALLYRPARVAAVGPFAVLDRRAAPDFDDARNRPSLAQTFEERTTGERFSVVVNHFKSKSGSCEGDPDTGDGQAACNGTRTRAALALARWLAGDPTRSGDPDVLILGDLNAYAREDPPRALAAAGYTDLVGRSRGEAAYTYAFRGRFGVLDYAFASPEMATQVTGAASWAINADEPDPPMDAGAGPYRSSDHDPVLVGLDLGGS